MVFGGVGGGRFEVSWPLGSLLGTSWECHGCPWNLQRHLLQKGAMTLAEGAKVLAGELNLYAL